MGSIPSRVQHSPYKYAGPNSHADETVLKQGRGYWLKANEAGTLLLRNVGGSVEGATYDWSKLRFSNGSEEKSISDAASAGWVDSYNLNFWHSDANAFRTICGSTGAPFNCNKTTLSSSEGIFVKSNADNLTLIRQN